jgi:hypothetical protein
MDRPIESKVTAATVATAVTGLVLWVLGKLVFRGDVPEPVAGAVLTVVPAIAAFVAGWWARHTPRPDLATKPPEEV